VATTLHFARNFVNALVFCDFAALPPFLNKDYGIRDDTNVDRFCSSMSVTYASTTPCEVVISAAQMLVYRKRSHVCTRLTFGKRK